MTQKKGTRLNKVAREFNIGISTIVDFLSKKGVEVDSNPNTKISEEAYHLILQEFSSDIDVKKESKKFNFDKVKKKKESVSLDEEEALVGVKDENAETADEKAEKQTGTEEPEVEEKAEAEEEEFHEKVNLKIVGKIDIEESKKKPKKEKTESTEAPPEEETEEEVAEEPVEIQEEVSAEEETEKEEVKETPKAEATEEEKPEEEELKEIEEEEPQKTEEKNNLKVVGKIDLDSINQQTRPVKKSVEKDKKKQKYQSGKSKPKLKVKPKQPAEKEAKETPQKAPFKQEHIATNIEELGTPKVVGRVDLQEQKKFKKKEDDDDQAIKKKRKRIRKEKKRVDIDEKGKAGGGAPRQKKTLKKKNVQPHAVNEEEVQKQIKETLAKLTSKGKSKGARHRKEKREAIQQKQEEQLQKELEAEKVIKVTEFISANEMANMMDVNINEVISTCMDIGLFVSINQRLDAETISLVAEAFNYKVEFTTVDVQEAIDQEEDKEEDMETRPPIVTVMGHVDHGKTKLLDHIRQTNIIAGESGGITQHIGAYNITLDNDREITFLDTPGHEAFTAMRARGAKVTDLAIIVVAADDGVKTQTKEAINHASAAGIPMVFAINKIDKPSANPEKVKEELAQMNYLVEDWGGKYQSQEISAKNGINVDELLEKVLLETDILELKANPHKRALGAVLESALDRGKGYVATVLVQTGTLKVGDIVVAGAYCGRVRALLNERNQRIDELRPSHPGMVLGLDGAPQAGDQFNVLSNEKEARDISNKRQQLQREQGIKAQKHVTLEELGRRIAIGNFKELNIIVKGDVDGSVEALADSLIKLSTEEIQVKIIHKGVGQITENDVNLASASDAIIVGFKVRPSASARNLAEKEKIDLRLYNVIYDAVEEVKAAMEGMLSPDIKEEVTANLEVLEAFKISKVGTIAGCMVKEGKIHRNSTVRLIRDGIVVYTGELGSLKRFKNDVKEVASGYECGLNIENFNDIKTGDIIEAYKEVEVERKLE